MDISSSSNTTGNKVLIEWGKATSNGKHNEVVLPFAYTNSNYKVVLTIHHDGTANGLSYTQSVDVSDKSTTKFYFSIYKSYDYNFWISIGY